MRAGVGLPQFEEMRQHGLQPNVYTYNALIKAECHVGNLTQVLQKLLSWKLKGVVHTKGDHCSISCSVLPGFHGIESKFAYFTSMLVLFRRCIW